MLLLHYYLANTLRELKWSYRTNRTRLFKTLF